MFDFPFSEHRTISATLVGAVNVSCFPAMKPAKFSNSIDSALRRVRRTLSRSFGRMVRTTMPTKKPVTSHQQTTASILKDVFGIDDPRKTQIVTIDFVRLAEMARRTERQ